MVIVGAIDGFRVMKTLLLRHSLFLKVMGTGAGRRQQPRANLISA